MWFLFAQPSIPIAHQSSGIFEMFFFQRGYFEQFVYIL